MSRRMRIGEVAGRTGLSPRTIRHYEDVGLVVPSARSKGGFRLYTDSDVDRLSVVRRMKPPGFALEEMRDLLGITDRLSSDEPPTGVERDRPRERPVSSSTSGPRRAAEPRCRCRSRRARAARRP